MKNNISEIILTVALIGLLLLFLNPLTIMLPQPLHPLMIPLLVVLFVPFAAMLWREQPGDEREQLHKFIASRFAYFAGASTLFIAIVIQHETATIDPWLLIILCVMLLAKIAGLYYSRIKH